jgi:plastocyanin
LYYSSWPPEYHHFQLRKDVGVINQTYIPDNVVVNPGNTMMWFSNDVGHSHNITLTDKNWNNHLQLDTIVFQEKIEKYGSVIIFGCFFV